MKEKARENLANLNEFKSRWHASQGAEGTWKATTYLEGTDLAERVGMLHCIYKETMCCTEIQKTEYGHPVESVWVRIKEKKQIWHH